MPVRTIEHSARGINAISVSSGDDEPPLTTRSSRQAVGGDLAYLTKLCDRGQALGWPKDDPLLAPAKGASDAMECLATAARYAGGA